MSLAPIAAIPARRLTMRLDAQEEVWVYWGCNGRDDVSRVHDLSSGGLFIETHRPVPTEAQASIHFLVCEGQIRAEGIVRHAKAACGLGLKFTTVMQEDQPKLAALLMRLNSLFRSHHLSQKLEIAIPEQ